MSLNDNQGSSDTIQLRQVLAWRNDQVTSVAWSHDGKRLPVGLTDWTIRIFKTDTYELEQTLEGHSNWVRSVVFTSDDRFVSATSYSGEVIVWRTDTFEEVVRYARPSLKFDLLYVGFRSSFTRLKNFERDSITFRTWDLSLSKVFAKTAATTPASYASAKIVLVGETEVGKSCLALRLAEDRYEEQGTTHRIKNYD